MIDQPESNWRMCSYLARPYKWGPRKLDLEASVRLEPPKRVARIPRIREQCFLQSLIPKLDSESTCLFRPSLIGAKQANINRQSGRLLALTRRRRRRRAKARVWLALMLYG